MEGYLKHHGISLCDSNDSIRGRYIQANQAIERGTVIITSQPLGTVPLPQTMNEVCNYCFRKQISPALQRCSQCKKAYFCDMGCFKNAWLSYHQFVCKKSTLSSHLAEDAMDLEMLERVSLNVARYRSRTQPESDGDQSEESVQVTMDAFFSLMGHDERQPKHGREKHLALAQEALKKPFLADTGLTVSELVHYLNVFKSNNFVIDDTDMFPVGEGTYPIASLFNHSCRPNAVVMYDGALAAIRAIEPIPAGDEITIGYVDPAHSRESRQQTLREKYFFSCSCGRCQPDPARPYLAKIDRLLGQELSDWDRAQQLLNNNYMDVKGQILAEVESWDLLTMCKQYDRKHDGQPDPTRPLSISHFTHYFIQFFAPYLLTWHRPDLHQPTFSTTSLNHFDDPLPSLAKPAVQATYDAILETAIDHMLSFPVKEDTTLIPYRLTTLSNCSRLFYDEMADGHWRNAVKLGMYVLIQYSLIYPPFHPMVAQHYLTLAKACWNSIVQSELIVGDLRLEKVYERGVRRWIMSSKETVSVAFGKHSKLWRETIELEWIFLREQKLK